MHTHALLLVKPLTWLLSQTMYNYAVELITTGSSRGQELSKTSERDRPFEQTIRIARVVIIHADKNFGKDVQLFASGFKPSRRDQETWSERRGVGGRLPHCLAMAVALCLPKPHSPCPYQW